MKVLIIDDSPTEVHVIKSFLLKNNFEVVVAEDGESGMAVALEELPDVILMDVVMPGLNGFQATRALNKDEKTAHIPIIILTTKDTETDKIWGMRQGAADYIVKPVTEKDLLQHINEVLS